MSFSVMTLVNRLECEADAWLMLEELRWGGTPACAHCGCTDVHYIAPSEGDQRATRTGSLSARRVWKCHKRGGGCGKQFSVTVGTIFHRSKIPMRTWLFVLFEMVASKNGVAAREIERKYGLTNKTAWHMLNRIREAMTDGPLLPMMKGTIVADETYIGGKAKNRHRQGKRRLGAEGTGGTVDKTPVLTLVNKTTGEARSEVLPEVTISTLDKVISGNVRKDESVLHTDGLNLYRTIGADFQAHEYVDHFAREYVRGDVSTNQAEGYFSQLKRSIDGTHHHVTPKHLPRYLAEFDFRYSTRHLDDGNRLARLMGQVAGKRLTYQDMIR